MSGEAKAIRDLNLVAYRTLGEDHPEVGQADGLIFVVDKAAYDANPIAFKQKLKTKLQDATASAPEGIPIYIVFNNFTHKEAESKIKEIQELNAPDSKRMEFFAFRGEVPENTRLISNVKQQLEQMAALSEAVGGISEGPDYGWDIIKILFITACGFGVGAGFGVWVNGPIVSLGLIVGGIALLGSTIYYASGWGFQSEAAKARRTVAEAASPSQAVEEAPLSLHKTQALPTAKVAPPPAVPTPGTQSSSATSTPESKGPDKTSAGPGAAT